MSDPLQASDLRGLPPAADIFTNRRPLKEFFAGALGRQVSALRTASVDRNYPRQNVVCFYGIGGVGKTQLLLRLKGWATGDQTMHADWGAQPLSPPAWARYVDLGGDWTVDDLLLALRSLASEAGVGTRAFDVGLYAWWTVSHPGMEMPAAGQTGSGWTSAIKDAASTALKEAGMPVGAGWLSGLLTDRLARAASKRQRKRTIAACGDLETVLLAISQHGDERAATAVAQLLDWDLGMLAPPERPVVVMFVDGFDTVQARGPSTEELIRRLAFATPHVMWVIAGRRRLTWGDDASGTRDFRGEDRWPQLAASVDSDQRRLGMLAPEDVDDYLARVLVAADGSPLLDEEIRALIVKASDGWPIYLDWACEHARRLVRRRAPLVAADFGQPLEGLVSRVAGDLSSEHRRALNAAALVRSFDAELLAAGAQIDEGSARRFLDEPIVNQTVGETAASHELHDVVREMIRTASIISDHAWAESDWAAAGDRMLAVLKARAGAATEPDVRLEATLAAFDIAADLRLRLPWIADGLFEHPARARVARQIVGRSKQAAGSWTSSVERVLSCWQTDGSTSLPDRLRAVADEPGLAGDLRRRALRYRAYSERSLTNHTVAEGIWAQLREQHDGPLLRFQHALTLVHLGRFEDALVLQRMLQDVGEAGKADRLAGEIVLQHGRIADAAAATARRRARAEEQKDWHNAMELQVAEARQRALLGANAQRYVEAAIARSSEYFAIGHLRSALCSRALCSAGDAEAVEAALTECAGWMRRFEQDEFTVHEAVARMFDAAVRHDAQAAHRAQRIIDEHERAQDTRWRCQLAWWRCYALGDQPPSFTNVQWLEDEREVRGRWLELVHRPG